MQTRISPTTFEKTLKLLKKTFGDKAPDICIMTGTAGPAFPHQTEGMPSLTFDQLGFSLAAGTKGHERKIYVFNLSGKRICLVAGRPHYFEGNSADQIAAIPRLVAHWGCTNFIITNASGSLNEKYQPGENIVVTDYDGTLPDPMIGSVENDFYGKKFYSKHYPFELQELLRESLSKYRTNNQHTDIGRYTAEQGPGFESKMTAKRLATHADLVGMSTKIEVDALLAIDEHRRQKAGGQSERIIRIGVISYVTNLTLAVDSRVSVSHDDNLAMMKKNSHLLHDVIVDAAKALKIDVKEKTVA